MKIVGIDAGSGVKSATGIAVLSTTDFGIDTFGIWPDNRKAKANERLRSLSVVFKSIINRIDCDNGLSSVVFESFAMRAKSGETLQRLIGAYMSDVPIGAEIKEVANTKIKQYSGGTGKADKEAVAAGVISWFKGKNSHSVNYVNQLIKNELWDEVDAVAIAISGYLES